MIALSPLQRDFLLVVHTTSLKRGRVFDAPRVCERLRIADVLCTDLFAWGEKQELLKRLPNGEAILTDAGMALGAKLMPPSDR